METTENKKGSDNALKLLDIIGQEEFEANGKKYFLEPQMSIERFREAQRLEIEISFSTTFKRHYAAIKELEEIMQEARFVDAAVKLRDLMQGMHRMDNMKDPHPVMKYCTLILNTHEEDRRKYDEKIMMEKIKDWEEEGIPVHSFFVLVLHSVSGLLETYKEIIQTTSKNLNQEEEPKEEASK